MNPAVLAQMQQAYNQINAQTLQQYQNLVPQQGSSGMMWAGPTVNAGNSLGYANIKSLQDMLNKDVQDTTLTFKVQELFDDLKYVVQNNLPLSKKLKSCLAGIS